MLLTHIYTSKRTLVPIAELTHTVYGNGEWFASDLHLNTDVKSRKRFSIAESQLPAKLPKWADPFDDVGKLLKQLEEIEAISFTRAYAFTFATSFLLRHKFDLHCRSICWNHPKQFARVSWGNELKYGIMIRQDDLVFVWDRKTMKMKIVASKNEGPRDLDPVRDQLSWQFHQATAYELNFEDIEKLSNANLAESRWRIAEEV